MSFRCAAPAGFYSGDLISWFLPATHCRPRGTAAGANCV